MDQATHAPLVEARRLRKTFHATRALDDVSLDVRRGEIHALIGENGAGKSTLIRILSGVHTADAGELMFDGAAIRLASPADALAAGIVAIPQEVMDVPAATVAENVLMGSFPCRKLFGCIAQLDRGAMRSQAEDLLSRLDVRLDVNRPVRDLGYAERQLVMIARALDQKARLLVLDEPTASLVDREVERLFGILDTLKNGGVGVIYVSHRLDEVERIADRVTVLRDGRRVASGVRGEFTRRKMAALMTGRDVGASGQGERPPPTGVCRLETADLRMDAGEIVGLAGLLGSGTTELMLRYYGAAGEVERVAVDGGETELRSPRAAIGHGVGYVPGSRAQGLVMGLSVRENIVLPALDRFRSVWGLDDAAIRAFAAEMMEALDIRPRDPDRPVRELSGGNQQKVIFGRWLAGWSRILLLDEPTHGIDVGARAQVHRLMREFAAEGGAILFASSEMGEVTSVGDRVLAMRAGEIVKRFERGSGYSEASLREALGG